MRRRRVPPRRGFTILELAIVLLITAILSGLAIVTYTRFADKARFTQAKTALKHLQKTELIYFANHDVYTDNLVVLDFDPTKYDFYQVSVALDNDAKNFTGYATGLGVMLGDLWSITEEGDPLQDNTSTFR